MLCQLCSKEPSIENSHGIPAFVSRHLKGSPPYIGLRCADVPNKAIQDVKKYCLLCTSCEARFNRWETPAAEYVFRPFCTTGNMEFEYGPWLHRFMASLAWRTLVLKLGKYECDPTIPTQAVAELRNRREMTRAYLLGDDHLGDQIEQHVILWKDPSNALPDLTRIDTNLVIRHSTVDDILIEKRNGWCATVHNHAGCFYVMPVRSAADDLWQGTLVNPTGGIIKQPQCVRGWIFNTFVQTLINTHQTMSSGLSERQKKKIADDVMSDAKGAGRVVKEDPYWSTPE